MNYVWYNGNYLPADEFSIGYRDRLFLYGDGLFESIYVRHTKARLLGHHLDRLQQGCNTLRINFPTALVAAPEIISELARRNTVDQVGKCKIHVWRQAGGALCT
ncbi:MAG: hypothetical protein HC842_07325 [Cytophagales bacterium]|nr:hypothetical protein [Cytophagales bacterium]